MNVGDWMRVGDNLLSSMNGMSNWLDMVLNVLAER